MYNFRFTPLLLLILFTGCASIKRQNFLTDYTQAVNRQLPFEAPPGVILQHTEFDKNYLILNYTLKEWDLSTIEDLDRQMLILRNYIIKLFRNSNNYEDLISNKVDVKVRCFFPKNQQIRQMIITHEAYDLMRIVEQISDR